MDELPTFDPVKVKCKSSDCDNDKHCYRPRRGQWKSGGERGVCSSCGDRTVDPAVARAFRTSTPEAIMAQLSREHIRDVFMGAAVDAKARRQLRKLGLGGVRARARQHLASRIGGASGGWDGRQTPKGESVLNLAQHATATCCRKCLYYWYDIPRERALREDELDFCETMIQSYLDRRALELDEIAQSPDEPT